jgi:ornithine cyclodeaminase/alanine dehydrogenase
MSSKLLYLSREDVEIVDLFMPKIIEAIEKGFQEMGHNRVEMPPKPGIHPGSGRDIRFT